MVYIKKLDVFGFKSFGARNVSLNFQRGLIAVTGPNGSGKSNILDAILFALGENSPKALRVDKLQSLFHDNSIKPNSNKIVKVSLTFDNEDRGIPIDNNLVTIRREMTGENTGESQYYLNNKRVSKNNILELLEIVVASPNKLNIVQQGMITRISELNTDERRKIIEDIIGLSYFDEKKDQAYKQLEESDRRLEIAMAKMDEVRKRINELEEERNYQHRFVQIESDMIRLKAIKLFDSIQRLSQKISSFYLEKKNKESLLQKLSIELEEKSSEIDKIGREKEQFFLQSNLANKDKIEIEKALSTIVYQYERNKAVIREAEHNINQLFIKEKSNHSEQNSYHQRLIVLKSQLEKIDGEIKEEEYQNNQQLEQLKELNKQLDEINRVNSNEINNKRILEDRISKLGAIKSEIEINTVRTEEKLKSYSDKVKENDKIIQDLLLKTKIETEMIKKFETALNEYHQKIELSKQEKQKLDNQISNLSKQIRLSKNVVENAEKIVIKYQEKIKLAKNSLAEDFAIATLSKDFDSLYASGYVFNLLSWDKKYQKAVIASGQEWMKAVVVKDVKSMIMLAEFSKNKKIPYLKIIPKQLLKGGKIQNIPDDPAILGVLSDFIQSKVPHLAEFLFGNIFLTTTPLAAYLLSNRGFKAVSTSGEIFYPDLSLMQFDYGSKIIDMTKDILLSDSVENLNENIKKLENITDIRQAELDQLKVQWDENEIQIRTLVLDKSNTEKQLGEIHNSLLLIEQNKRRMINQSNDNSVEIEHLYSKYSHSKKRLEIIQNTIDRLTSNIKEIDKRIENQQIKIIYNRKSTLSNARDLTSKKINQLKLNHSITKNNLDNTNLLYQKSLQEKEQIELEKIEKKNILENSSAVGEEIEEKLKNLRDKENEIIQSTSSNYEKLREFEKVLKELSEQEKRLNKNISQIEKEIGFLTKDLEDLEDKKLNHSNELSKSSYRDIHEIFDVDDLYYELKKEYEEIKENVNFRADETYREIIEGYRGLSEKRNLLEEERNSIVRFIEEISKEKETVFNDAFKKVDDDIRKTFSDITGGNAWLELENKENIFSGGIMLMVQFPNKPPRESTSLSGGEKTMAAIVFLLALQSLKPSPFYLMDEVDAHLDAQNTDRLSKILLLRSVNSQIIMVTLKDSTVAKSDLIYGVYPKEGISQVVKYNHPSKVKLEAN